MIPTHGNDSSGDDSQEPGHDSSTTPIPLPKLRRTPRLRTLRLALRHPRPARPSTVWPCAQDDLREGTGLLASWLLTAVIKIVTNYTQPGQRVLLLDPAPPASQHRTAVRNRPWHGPYVGLLEAGWTVVRLGRGIQTQTAIAHPDPIGEHPVDAPAEPESGPGPLAESPTADHPVRPLPDRPAAPDPTAPGHSPDRYDLIITAAEPHTLDWFRPTDWTGLLTANGTLAVITHGDQSSSQLADPAGALVHAAHHAGLRYLDRIALLRIPVRDGVLAAASPAVRDCSQAASGWSTTAVRHTQVHDDLMVFSRQPASANGEETSDG